MTKKMKMLVKAIRLVFFDFDQTLVDTIKSFDKAFSEIKNEFQKFLDGNDFNIVANGYEQQISSEHIYRVGPFTAIIQLLFNYLESRNLHDF